jgi:hypothetical protein
VAWVKRNLFDRRRMRPVLSKLSFFTGVDLLLMLLGFPTSTQQLIARKLITGGAT